MFSVVVTLTSCNFYQRTVLDLRDKKKKKKTLTVIAIATCTVIFTYVVVIVYHRILDVDLSVRTLFYIRNECL